MFYKIIIIIYLTNINTILVIIGVDIVDVI